MDLLPSELLLQCISQFQLGSLIVARGVCRRWRTLLMVAEIHPIRRIFLDIYLQVITEPWFLETRAWTLSVLQPFDRKAYIDALLEQHSYLPEDFALWVLEWPAPAVFGDAWPGLPFEFNNEAQGPLTRQAVWNHLNQHPPVVWTVDYTNKEPSTDWEVHIQPLPGVPISQQRQVYSVWLLLDERDEFRDQVLYKLYDHQFPEYPIDKAPAYQFHWSCWIDYLKDEVKEMTRRYDKWKADESFDWFVEPRGPVERYKIPCIPWTECASRSPYTRPAYIH